MRHTVVTGFTIFLSTIFSSLSFAETAHIMFYNVSDKPVELTTLYTKDESVSVAYTRTYDDPNKFTFINGGFRIEGGKAHKVFYRLSTSFNGKKGDANLLAFRVERLCANGSIHDVVPSQATPLRRMVPTVRMKENWTYHTAGVDDKSSDDYIKALISARHQVAAGNYYHKEEFAHRRSDPQARWYGVGAQGSMSAKSISLCR